MGLGLQRSSSHFYLQMLVSLFILSFCKGCHLYNVPLVNIHCNVCNNFMVGFCIWIDTVLRVVSSRNKICFLLCQILILWWDLAGDRHHCFHSLCGQKVFAPSLERACMDYLVTDVNTSNVCYLLCCLLARSCHIEEPKLLERCWNIIDSKTENTLLSDSFTEVDYQTLVQILGRDTLRAKETVVFAAAIRWAKAECTRQGRDTSPQQCREVLGEALYFLRFPTMTLSDFADGAGKNAGLLSMQETNDLLLYFSARDKPKLRFLTSCRNRHHGRQLNVCRRFTSVSSDTRAYQATCERIQFLVDKSISLAGFGLYGSRCKSAKYEVTIMLKLKDFPIRAKTDTIVSDGFSDTFRVFFDNPCLIEPMKNYTVKLFVKNGTSGYFGENGRRSTECTGMITFSFSKTLGSCKFDTGVGKGQIPEILFYHWTKDHIIRMRITIGAAIFT